MPDDRAARLRRRLARLRSFRLRAVLVVLAVVLVPVALVAASTWWERRVDTRLQADVRACAAEAARLLGDDPAPRARYARLDAVARRYDVRLRLATPAGRSLLDIDHDAGVHPAQRLGALFFGADGAPTLGAFDAGLGPLAARPEVRAALALGGASVGCRRSPGDKLLVCHAARAVAGATGAGDLVVYAQESSRRPVRALYDLRYQLGKLTLFMLPVGLVLAWWLGWRTVRPIEALRRQVLDKAARAAPGADLDLPRDDEVGDLVAAFNALLAALAARRAANEAFAADLVHELKNPIAAIRACAEALEGVPPDAARAVRLAGILGDSTRRLDALVTCFLEIARAEAGMPHEPRTRVDLVALATGLIDAQRGAAPGVAFALHAPPRAEVVGVAHRLDSALRNLLDNAASFAGAGGRVEVTVADAGERVEVAVADSGPGIAPEDLPRVFNRFFTTRAPAARGYGTGLGLALTRAVVEAHGGVVSATSTPGAGAVFRVALPRDPGPPGDGPAG